MVRQTSTAAKKAGAIQHPPPVLDDPIVPPTYNIDLSLAPSERYKEVARDFASELRNISSLFSSIVGDVGLPYRPVEVLARVLLRRVHSAEETAELAGIADAAGVALHHLIALNTFLDAFMGCTSGGARISGGRDKEGREKGERMLHFRTLDWG